MNLGNIRVKRLDPRSRLPAKAYESDAGFDICILDETVLQPETTTSMRTGIAIAPPPGWWFLLHGRSSIRAFGLEVVTAVIDGGYRGEIFVAVHNPGKHPHVILEGERIAQLVPMPIGDFMIYEASSLPDSERGSNGFGSSGRQ